MKELQKPSVFPQMKIDVKAMPAKEAEPWLLQKHYARRMCPISYAYGAYRDGELIGVVTYGTPLSSTLRDGIAGHEWSSCVLELNRLCCNSEKNLASILVGRSLAMLPKPSIVVSYADTSQGHIGYIYQATNFIYTGLSAKFKDPYVVGMEHKHHTTIGDMGRGHPSRVEYLRKTYGIDNVYYKDRPRKHRYVYLCGDKRQKQSMRDALRYHQEPYPKGESRRYDASSAIETQSVFAL
jgi:hypothetical protein